MAGTTLTLDIKVDGRAYASITRGLNAVADHLDTALQRAAPGLAKSLQAALMMAYKEMERRHGSPWPAGTVAHSNPSLFKRSGGGLKSIKQSIRVAKTGPDSLSGFIGAGFPIAVHEKGATIRPKRAQFLTIPLPAAMNSRGIPIKKKARDWQNTFVAKSKKGNLLIFQKRGREIVPLYLLKKQVKLRARLGLGKAVVNKTLPHFERAAFETISREIDKRIR